MNYKLVFRLFFLTLFLFNIGKSYAAAQFVNSWINEASSSSSADFTVAASITPTSGNLLILGITVKHELATTPNIMGWVFRGSNCSPLATACIYIYSKIASGSENLSVLLDNQDLRNSATISVLEYSGALNILNSVNTNSAKSRDVLTETITTTYNNELLLAFYAVDKNVNNTAWSNDFIQRVDYSITRKNYELNYAVTDKNINQSGTHFTSTTISRSENWSTVILNFATLDSTTSDLGLSKTVSNTNPGINQIFSYTVSVFNYGGRDNFNIFVTDTMPPGVVITSTLPSDGTTYDSTTGTWNVGNLQVGQTKNLTISAFPQASIAGTTITNTTSILSASIPDSDLSNNTQSVSINIKAISSKPSINTPIVEGDTQISGITSGPDGSTINVFNGGTLIGSTTSGGGTWAASVVTVSGGNSITAKATFPGCCESPASDPVIVLFKTPVPTITIPVYAGSSILRGTISENNGAVIEVYLNNSFLNSTNSSGGNWSLAVPKTTFTTGQAIKVRGTATGKYVSNFSNNVLVINAVSPTPAITSNIVAGDTVIRGSSLGDDGTIIEILKYRNGNESVVGYSVVSDNQWLISGLESLEVRSGDIFKARARIDSNNDGSNNSSDIYSELSTGVTASLRSSQVPSIFQAESGDTLLSGTSLGPDGTLIKIYQNDVFFETALVSDYQWSVSTDSLIFGDSYKATATFDNDNNGVIDENDTESGFSSTIIVDGTPPTKVPSIYDNLIAGNTIINGEVLEEDGTEVKIYVDNVLIGSTTVTNNYWELIVPESTLQSGESVAAKATAEGKTQSNTSTTIIVINKVPPVPFIQPIKAGSTRINGSVISKNGDIVEVLINGTIIGNTTVLNNEWSLEILPTELQAGEIVQGRVHIDYDNDGIIELDDESSALSHQVVATHKATPVPTLNPIGFNSKSISGTLSSEENAKIYVYRYRDGVRELLGVTTTNSPEFYLNGVISQSWAIGDLITSTSLIDTNNDGQIDENDIESDESDTQIIYNDEVFNKTRLSDSQNDSCKNSKPSGVPTIYRIENLIDSIRIYFLALNQPRDRFEYEYVNLVDEGKRYGIINNLEKGIFEIPDINTKENYKVRIRALNGCSRGNWSEYKTILDNFKDDNKISIFNSLQNPIPESFNNEIFEPVFQESFEAPFGEPFEKGTKINSVESNSIIYYIISALTGLSAILISIFKFKK